MCCKNRRPFQLFPPKYKWTKAYLLRPIDNIISHPDALRKRPFKPSYELVQQFKQIKMSKILNNPTNYSKVLRTCRVCSGTTICAFGSRNTSGSNAGRRRRLGHRRRNSRPIEGAQYGAPTAVANVRSNLPSPGLF